MSSLIGKLEVDVDIGVSAEKFYGVFCSNPIQLCTICPEIFQACDLLDGLWGTLGAITHWTYLQDGVAKNVKMVLELVDPINKSFFTYGVIEGDLMSAFSGFTGKFETIAKDDGGCRVHFTLEYIKLNPTVPPPQAELELAIQAINAIGESVARAI